MSAEQKKKVPQRLAALLVAFGEKITGAELNECIEGFRRDYEHSLSDQQERVCRTVLEDEGVAQYYGYERAEGLESIRRLRNKCQYAIDALIKTDRSWYDSSMLADLRGIARKAEEAAEHYAKNMAELKMCIAEADKLLTTKESEGT